MPEFVVNGTTYMSTGDVADALDMPRATLLSLISRGVLPDVKKQVYVTRRQRGFTQEWLEEAAEKLGRQLNNRRTN